MLTINQIHNIKFDILSFYVILFIYLLILILMWYILFIDYKQGRLSVGTAIGWMILVIVLNILAPAIYYYYKKNRLL